MKTFTCGPELAEILIKNGFVDTTPIDFPKHVENPTGKRMYRLSPKSKNCIQFDYITLKSYDLHLFETSITEEQLKALICFHKLHHRSQYAVKAASNQGLSGIVKLIKDMQSEDSYIRKSRLQLTSNVLQVYNNIVL